MFCYNPGHNILTLFDVLPIFLSLQVKRSVIISNTAQKIKLTIKDFFSKCDQTSSFHDI